MKQPKISIIVPIYNVEKYLDECMLSLLNQTLKDIEIILVDDGSPDKCGDICDSLAKPSANTPTAKTDSFSAKTLKKPTKNLQSR